MLVFLATRRVYIQGMFEVIERERTMDAAYFLKKRIDLWRGLSIFLERTTQCDITSRFLIEGATGDQLGSA